MHAYYIMNRNGLYTIEPNTLNLSCIVIMIYPNGIHFSDMLIVFVTVI